MIIGVNGMGLRKYQPGMPLARTALLLQQLAMWREERKISNVRKSNGNHTDGTGHCAFSSGEPAFPQEGVAYK